MVDYFLLISFASDKPFNNQTYNTMKKIIPAIALGVVMLALPSCSGDGKPLSASSAKSALKKEAIFAKDSQVKTFETGFQEVSEEYLNSLAQLKAAGVIDFTVETATEIRQNRSYSYWSGYTYTPYEVTHYFADVQLSEAGKKFIIEEPTTVRSDLKDLLKANKDYEEKVPDFMNASYSGISGRSATSPDEGAIAVEAEEVFVEDSAVVEAVVEEVAQPEQPKKSASKNNPNEKFESMLAKVNTESVNVLLGRFELVKIKDVLCTEDMFKAGKGSCTVYVKFIDKTPFGFVLGAPSEGYLQATQIKFIHYQDTGWVVEDMD